MLGPVKKKSTVEAAIEVIGNYIASELHEGDQLPGERELAERLQISRNIIREALQHFRTLGIIESRPKTGSVVARLLPANPYAGYMPFITAAEHSFEELLEWRRILESGICESAVVNVVPADIVRLRELAEKMLELLPIKGVSGRTAEFDADVEFHSILLRLSGNQFCISLIPLVVEFFAKNYLCNCGDVRREGYEEHFQIIAALEKRDAAALRELLLQHTAIYRAFCPKQL